ncbi:hypothetical protein BDQ17DRAFT_347601 [Cyathus striatus]|nr:hypothetical protein BDQ17DRAFT_347601 [Cyathus striatus]
MLFTLNGQQVPGAISCCLYFPQRKYTREFNYHTGRYEPVHRLLIPLIIAIFKEPEKVQSPLWASMQHTIKIRRSVKLLGYTFAASCPGASYREVRLLLCWGSGGRALALPPCTQWVLRITGMLPSWLTRRGVFLIVMRGLRIMKCNFFYIDVAAVGSTVVAPSLSPPPGFADRAPLWTRESACCSVTLIGVCNVLAACWGFGVGSLGLGLLLHPPSPLLIEIACWRGVFFLLLISTVCFVRTCACIPGIEIDWAF